jgi:predicted transposase YbfD/YdcC
MATRVGHLAGRRVIAVDGKTMRGARTTAGAPHLVAALDQSAGAVLGQLAVASKSNEIPALRDLLTSMNITDAVISADAMHCQRDTANHITGRGGHYILTIKANQPTLRAACKALPWQDVPAVTTTDTSHGRRVRRTIKAVEAPDWIDFPGRRPDHPTPPHPNHQGPQNNRSGLRDLLTGHDRRRTSHRRHLDPGPLGRRERPALGP